MKIPTLLISLLLLSSCQSFTDWTSGKTASTEDSTDSEEYPYQMYGILDFPIMFPAGSLIIIGEKGSEADTIASMNIAMFISQSAKHTPPIRLDKDAPELFKENLIIIGNPCTNTLAKELLGTDECSKGLSADQARIKIFYKNTKYSMLICGQNDKAAFNIIKKLVENKEEFKGKDIILNKDGSLSIIG